ncbi:MAG: biotin--[acetyl-CoA-carboxylase] ligase [Deltaproteobacteria bacterium]|nr:biotin--[acetyl-CoA-carboxylase] ligase [Deltaproteobacteria bacterium]
MDTAKELAEKGAASGTVVRAFEQTSGRGRLGRSWFSKKGGGIFFTLILDADPALAAKGITVAAGLAIATALENLTGARPSLKWPNDLLFSGRKVAGILTECGNETDGKVFIGAGVNVNVRYEEFPEEIRESAGSLLSIFGRTFDSEDVFRNILDSLDGTLYDFLAAGGIDAAAVEKYLMGIGGRCSGDGFHGIIRGLDRNGSLIVEGGSGETVRVRTGEVSIETGAI